MEKIYIYCIYKLLLSDWINVSVKLYFFDITIQISLPVISIHHLAGCGPFKFQLMN